MEASRYQESKLLMIKVGTVDFLLVIGRAKRDKNNQVVRDFEYLTETFKKGFTNK